ncbi:MAG: hypothetical protein MUE69_28125 [Myxococcota bacterium]|nr:hypothetical protein [Myxococcota bacterium]
MGATSAEWLLAALANSPEGPLRLAELIAPVATAPLATPVAAAERAELIVGLAFREPIDPRGLLLGARRRALTVGFAEPDVVVHAPDELGGLDVAPLWGGAPRNARRPSKRCLRW